MQALNKYKLFVFDWEGTIIDSVGAVFNVISLAAKKLDYPEFDKIAARKYIGFSLPLLLTKLYPELARDKMENLLIEIGILSKKANMYLAEGVMDVFETLIANNKILAIASNCNYDILCKKLEDLNLDKIFTIVRAAGIAPLKPSPKMLEEIILESGLSCEDTIVIGDSVTDISMAQALHVDAVGIDLYYQNAASLLSAGAFRIFHDYLGFKDLLCSKNLEGGVDGF